MEEKNRQFQCSQSEVSKAEGWDGLAVISRFIWSMKREENEVGYLGQVQKTLLNYAVIAVGKLKLCWN